MSDKIRLGIAGLGTVGVGVIKIVETHRELLQARSGKSIEIAAVSARSRGKDRGVAIDDYAWEDDPTSLATRDDVDVFVELMGGEGGPAKAAVESALAAGKDVVTANKALLAIHGHALAKAAEANNVNLRFEAAVAGGIPVIKSLTEGLAGNQISRVIGVMNGTCNYILTRMETAGLTYEEVFKEADALGYLEADPNLDVGGIDAAHKLVLLSSIAFGTQVDFDSAVLEGIGQITIEDIKAAGEMGYRIKLLGVSQMTENGLSQSMRPSLVPQSSPLAQLEGGTNMVVIEADSVQQVVLRGPGAGEGPTASAVMGDVMDIARGLKLPVFGQPAESLKLAKSVQVSVPHRFYLRLSLKDEAGIFAKVSDILGKRGISIERLRQEPVQDNIAKALIVTHEVDRETLNGAMAEIEQSGAVVGNPIALRIEQA